MTDPQSNPPAICLSRDKARLFLGLLVVSAFMLYSGLHTFSGFGLIDVIKDARTHELFWSMPFTFAGLSCSFVDQLARLFRGTDVVIHPDGRVEWFWSVFKRNSQLSAGETRLLFRKFRNSTQLFEAVLLLPDEKSQVIGRALDLSGHLDELAAMDSVLIKQPQPAAPQPS